MRQARNRRTQAWAMGLAGVAALVAAVLFVQPELLPGARAPVARVPLPSFTRIDLPAAEPVDEADAALPARIDAAEAADLAALTAARPGGPPAGAPRPSLATTRDAPDAGTIAALATEPVIVRKVVRVNNREAGSMPIHIDARSRLLVDPADLGAVLARAGVQRGTARPAAGQAMLSFSELRAGGLDLRYDPESDSVVITTG
ncbi:hypothetical protein K3172_03975 [Qipengyuania sp. 6B39]|uniref:hypothetical protein n=1 Tax=Qipengyuania proteolytica TaxID=2867239 RepID=UPI001C89F345|nr:hypothetical protein [Qipengyuania proteolytica]MBX7495013.1 hypothetical protein [Qipengyuania proteolytica]